LVLEGFLLAVRGQRGPRVGVPAWLTGLVERVFFTVLVAVEVPGVPTAMIAWLGAKMAANWNRQPGDGPAVRAGAVTALLGGLLSMLFAYVGGWICSGRLYVGL
jgi:hypothetical protein